MATYLLLLCVAWIDGVAATGNCHSVRVFLSGLLTTSLSASGCRSVPFTADDPSIILAVTSPFAVAGYYVLVARLNTLIRELTETQLLRSHRFRRILFGAQLAKLRNSWVPSRTMVVLSFAVALFIGGWFYYQTVNYGPVFEDFARTSHSPGVTVASLRDSWWANVHHHALLAALWVVIGTVGAYYAARIGYIYLRVFVFLTRITRSARSDLPSNEGEIIRYVPSWKQPNFGWRPVSRVLNVAYLSWLNFMLSFIAIFDMLRGSGFTVALALAVGCVGMLANLCLFGSVFYGALRLHQHVIDREKGRLSRTVWHNLRKAPPALSPTAHVDAVLDLRGLAQLPRLPFGNTAITAVKVAPALVTLARLVGSLVTTVR